LITDERHRRGGCTAGPAGARVTPVVRTILSLACGVAWLLGGTAPSLAQGPQAAAAEENAAQAEIDNDDFDFDAYESDEDDEEEDAYEGVVEAPAEDSTYGDIETIVVTGTASEAAGDLSASDSIASFDSEELGALGAQDVSDLAAFTPNLEIVTAGATTPTFFIRGVGLNDFNSNSTGAVAIYQDDVPINAPAMQLPSLFDVATVNVLRGPQGTGLARNASAGAIKIYSRKPSGDFGGFLRVEGGNYNFIDLEGAVESPVWSDKLSARLAFRFSARDGTMENRCGDAPPFSERVPAPRPGDLTALGLRNTDPPWSICGEPVDTLQVSEIPTGLATRVNDLGNWAIRGTLLYEPTAEQEWLFGIRVSQRDEYARLGQSIGTSGFYCADGNVDNCFGPLANRTARVAGLLGGTQASIGEYQAPEIRARLLELAPCYTTEPGLPNGTCDRPDAQGGNRELGNSAKIQLANELAAGLDSEPWAGDFNRTGKVQNDTIGGNLKGTIKLADEAMIFTTLTSYDHYDRTNDVDLDFSPQTLFQIFTDDRGWQATQTLRLEGFLGSKEQVSWDVGTYFLGEQLNVGVDVDLGDLNAFAVGKRDYTQNLFSVAGYGSLAWNFWDNFTLDGGVRYNWERKTLDYALYQGNLPDPFLVNLDENWHAPTGTVRLRYRFRADMSVFAKYTRGWKPGTFNATGSVASGVTVASPETIDAYEAGISGSWFEDRLGLNTNFFYYSYDDYQLFLAQQFAGGPPEFVIVNADGSEVYGAEVDATARPWTGALAQMRFGWLESQFLDFVQVQQEVVSSGGTQQVLSRELLNTGNPLLNAPRFKVSLTGEQGYDTGKWGTFTARYDGVWTATTYYDATEGVGIPNVQNVQFLPENTIAQEAFWLHNLRVSYRPESDRFELALWVRNITNQAYKNFAFDGSTFQNTSIYFVGDPRTFGGTVNWNF